MSWIWDICVCIFSLWIIDRVWRFCFGRNDDPDELEEADEPELLTDGQEDEEPVEEADMDDRTVTERLENGGFTVYDEGGHPRESMRGWLKLEDAGESCVYDDCGGDYVELREVAIASEASAGRSLPLMILNHVGDFCDACGHFRRDGDASEDGVFGKLDDDSNIFDFLDRLSGGSKPGAKDDDAALAAREAELDRRLCDLRIRRMRLAEENGRVLQLDAYREAPLSGVPTGKKE